MVFLWFSIIVRTGSCKCRYVKVLLWRSHSLRYEWYYCLTDIWMLRCVFGHVRWCGYDGTSCGGDMLSAMQRNAYLSVEESVYTMRSLNFWSACAFSVSSWHNTYCNRKVYYIYTLWVLFLFFFGVISVCVCVCGTIPQNMEKLLISSSY